jgi:hypothetical protein
VPRGTRKNVRTSDSSRTAGSNAVRAASYLNRIKRRDVDYAAAPDVEAGAISIR